MPEQSAHEKGDSLENAVRAIERAILSRFPGYSEDTFTIESKKILRVAGVKHEIDVFVMVRHGAGYDSTFIFECRNREEKANKNDIIVFSEKIKATNAQRGFFVARGFTGDAEAQSATDGRLELLRAEQLDPATIDIPFGLHGVEVKRRDAHVDVTLNPTPSSWVAAVAPSAPFVVRGEPRNFQSYADQWTQEASDGCLNRLVSKHVPAGLHHLAMNESRYFRPGEAFFKGRSIVSMQLTGTVAVLKIACSVESAFDITTRGRFIKTKMMFPDAEVSLDLTQTYDRSESGQWQANQLSVKKSV
jgi:hypothetical protein